MIRVGLLVDGPTIDAWAAEAVAELRSMERVEIALVVENTDADDPRDYVENVRRDGLWALYKGLGLVRRRWFSPPEYRKQRPVGTVVGPDTPVVTCTPIPTDGIGVEFPDGIVDRVRDETDVLVRFGFGIVQGEILTAPKYGVLSYHHGDVRAYRGRPAGFWEFMHGESSAGVTVQVLSERLDAGEIAAETAVDISDATDLGQIRRRLFARSAALLPTAVENVRTGRTEAVDELGPVYTRPGTVDFCRFLLRQYV